MTIDRNTDVDPGVGGTPDPEERDPAEGRTDLDLPGADRPMPEPDADDLPEELGRRISDPGSGIAAGQPDVLPDVEPSEATM